MQPQLCGGRLLLDDCCVLSTRAEPPETAEEPKDTYTRPRSPAASQILRRSSGRGCAGLMVSPPTAWTCGDSGCAGKTAKSICMDTHVSAEICSLMTCRQHRSYLQNCSSDCAPCCRPAQVWHAILMPAQSQAHS